MLMIRVSFFRALLGVFALCLLTPPLWAQRAPAPVIVTREGAVLPAPAPEAEAQFNAEPKAFARQLNQQANQWRALAALPGVRVNALLNADGRLYAGTANYISAPGFLPQVFVSSNNGQSRTGVGKTIELRLNPTTTGLAGATPLPTALAGTRVTVRDSAGAERSAPLFFVSPGQINYQAPPNTAAGPATVIVTSSARASAFARAWRRCRRTSAVLAQTSFSPDRSKG